MTSWEVEFLDEALNDLRKLDGSVRPLVLKAIRKVQGNPLPADRGGYGKPLANRSGLSLAGLMKIKLRGSGIRIVYKLVENAGIITIIVVGMRSDSEVYREAQKRRDAHNL